MSFAVKFLWFFFCISVFESVPLQPLTVSFPDDTSLEKGKINKISVLVKGAAKGKTEVTLMIDGNNFAFADIENNVCQKNSSKSSTKIIEFDPENESSVEYYVIVLRHGEFLLKAIARKDGVYSGFENKFKTYEETDGIRKFFDLRNMKFDSFYVNNENKELMDTELKVTGDLIGETLKHVDVLFDHTENHWPFAFLYAAKYLVSVDQLPDSTKSIVQKTSANFYNEIISRKIKKGWNLNVFRGPVVSTAFVVKFLSIAEKWIEIDAVEIPAALELLAGEQDPQGSFKAETVEKEVALTAFILISFLENDKYVSIYEGVIDKSLEFINSKFDKVNEPYTLAIASYALSMKNQENSEKFLGKLMKNATEQDGIFWKIDSDEAKEIETAAYAILAHSAIGKSHEAAGIYKWLASKYDSQIGAFTAVSDTMVAYQAAAEISKHHFSKEFDLKVLFTVENTKPVELLIDNSNKGKTQTLKIPGNSGISINVEGKGVVLVETKPKFKVIRKDLDKKTEKDLEIFEACADKNMRKNSEDAEYAKDNEKTMENPETQKENSGKSEKLVGSGSNDLKSFKDCVSMAAVLLTQIVIALNYF